MRVVLDANVLIAAYAARGLCEAVVEYCLSSGDIYLTEEILADVGEKLLTKISVPAADVKRILAFLRAYATVVDPEPVAKDLCRDPDDVGILGAAKASRADYIITGDEDLLILGSFLTTEIVNPRTFWESQARPR